MKRCLVLFALLAACKGDDPYAGGYGGESCEAGSYRDPGPGCTVAPLPALTVDGNAIEWEGDHLLYAHSASCCSNGDPAALHIGRLDDGSALGMYMPIVGAPNLTGDVYYDVHFRRYGMYAGQTGDVNVDLIVTPTAAYPQVNGIRVYGVPLDHKFGPDGLEMRVPVDALPYPGVAYVEAWLVRASDNSPVDADPFSSIACWDPTSVDGSCSAF